MFRYQIYIHKICTRDIYTYKLDGRPTSQRVTICIYSIAEGFTSPITMYTLSGAIDEFGKADRAIANGAVNKYGLRQATLRCYWDRNCLFY